MHRTIITDDQEELMYQPQIEDTLHTDDTLFRQAIVHGDGEAWAALCSHYRPLLIHWVNQCPASTWLDESSLDLADQAFARAWKALRAAGFANFANLAALLGYLRTCVITVVIDCVRAQTARTRMRQKLDDSASATPEQLVLHQAECSELWRLVSQVVATAQERAILYECFVLDLPPRLLLTRHPDLFASINSVYAAKRNLLDRLRRNPELHHFDWKQ
jgi:DNA-directed RNA polymerase specialized sigma24 family protein